MATLSFDGIYYRVDGQRVEPGVTIRRYDPIAETWYEGEVGNVSSHNHEAQERTYSLALVVPGYAPSPLSVGDTIEIVSKAELDNREMNEHNRVMRDSRDKPWLPFDEDGE